MRLETSRNTSEEIGRAVIWQGIHVGEELAIIERSLGVVGGAPFLLLNQERSAYHLHAGSLSSSVGLGRRIGLLCGTPERTFRLVASGSGAESIVKGAA